MKQRILSLLAAFVVLVAQAADWPYEAAGAWYQTTNPGATIQAGALHLYFNEDFTVEVELYMDGFLVAEGTGTWKYLDKKQTRATWKFTDDDGWTYTGTAAKGVIKGTFKGPSGPMRGQVVASDASVMSVN